MDDAAPVEVDDEPTVRLGTLGDDIKQAKAWREGLREALCPNRDWSGYHCEDESCVCLDGRIACDFHADRPSVTTVGTEKLPLCAACANEPS